MRGNSASRYVDRPRFVGYRTTPKISKSNGNYFQQGNLRIAPHKIKWPRIARRRETISAIPPCCALWGFWCLNMAKWVRYPLPLLWAFPLWRACGVEVRYPPRKGVSQRYLRDTLWKQGKSVRYSPLRCYLKAYCAILGGVISHWAAKLGQNTYS